MEDFFNEFLLPCGFDYKSPYWYIRSFYMFFNSVLKYIHVNSLSDRKFANAFIEKVLSIDLNNFYDLYDGKMYCMGNMLNERFNAFTLHIAFMKYVGFLHHGHSRDSFSNFNFIIMFGMPYTITDDEMKLFPYVKFYTKKELVRNFTLEPCQPEYEIFNGINCTLDEVKEYAYDRMSKIIQLNGGVYKGKDNFIPQWTFYNDKNVNYYKMIIENNYKNVEEQWKNFIELLSILLWNTK